MRFQRLARRVVYAAHSRRKQFGRAASTWSISMSVVRLPQYSSPLNDEQVRQLESLASTLSPSQAMWVRGYLAGLHAAEGNAIPATSATAAPTRSTPLTILYGSQTGNAESVARLLQDAVRGQGIEPALIDMLDYKPRNLKKEESVLIVVSTQGEGEPPDGAQEFYGFLHGNKAPNLSGLRFSVLALGDSSYEYFCKTGKDIDRRLTELGAHRVHPRADCDVDYDESATEWINSVTMKFTSEHSGEHPTVTPLSTSSPLPVARTNEVPSRKHPCRVQVLANTILNGRGSEREIHHIELATEGSGLIWEPGDSIGVIPQNSPELVDEVIDALALKRDEIVDGTNGDVSLRDALIHHFEITALTPPLIEKYAELTGSQRLGVLFASDGRTALAEYMRGRQLIDLIKEFPVRGVSGREFVRLLRRLPPRQYSVASSYAANPDEVHLTVAAVRYSSCGRERQGVASVYLSDRASEGSLVSVYVDRNSNFRLPGDDVSVIMIGPGTGVAPFRAFMEEREERGARGRNWLFFGAQHFLTDFYYQIDWLRWRENRVLTKLDVAFSRDQSEKVYVQDRIREQAREVYAWLEDGAHIYVCGDAARMAPDVHAALSDIVSSQGSMSADATADYLVRLQKEKRYHRDVY